MNYELNSAQHDWCILNCAYIEWGLVSRECIWGLKKINVFNQQPLTDTETKGRSERAQWRGTSQGSFNYLLLPLTLQQELHVWPLTQFKFRRWVSTFLTSSATHTPSPWLQSSAVWLDDRGSDKVSTQKYFKCSTITTDDLVKGKIWTITSFFFSK